MYCLNIRVCKQLWFRSCCSAHAAGMINTRYINYDSFLLANSHKNKSSWWRGGFINFQPALTNESAWKGRGAECMLIGGLLGQCAHCASEKKSDVYAIINLSASISTPETFLNTKAKCPLDVSEAVSLLVGGYLEQKTVHFFRHREAAQHWLQTWRTIKSHWQKKNTFVVSNIKKCIS